jgi:hypothetical protein
MVWGRSALRVNFGLKDPRKKNASLDAHRPHTKFWGRLCFEKNRKSKKNVFLPVFIKSFDSIFLKIRFLEPIVHIMKKKTLKPSNLKKNIS